MSARTTRIGAVRSVLIARPAAATLEKVRDIALLEPLERKARAVEVHPTDARSGWYRIDGRLVGLVPWTGEFSYEQHEQGWHSADLHPREDGWVIGGGFVVTPVTPDVCRVTHYEDYGLPAHLAWLRRPLTLYMRWSQVGEMRDLVTLVEDLVPAPTAGIARIAG